MEKKYNFFYSSFTIDKMKYYAFLPLISELYGCFLHKDLRILGVKMIRILFIKQFVQIYISKAKTQLVDTMRGHDFYGWYRDVIHAR